MNEGACVPRDEAVEAIVERAYADYSKGDLFTMRDAVRQAAKEAWEQATLEEREACAKMVESFWHLSIEEHFEPSVKLIAMHIRARGQREEQGDE